MSLKEPIVEGAWYLTDDATRGVFGPMILGSEGLFWSRGVWFRADGTGASPSLTRRVYLVPTDPAEVVAELRRMRHSAMTDVANWLAQKLGVK